MNWLKRECLIKFSQDDQIVDKLLKIRGISNKQGFLYPSEDVQNDPYLLENITEASHLILKALRMNKKIAVSMDCDTDGIVSTAQMVRYLAKFTKNIYIMYNQRSEGHGIENQMSMLEEDTGLVIILDSSTNSIDTLKTLHDKGIDVVVLDHHDREKNNQYGLNCPYATIVNPKLDSTYPNEHISGSGVTYKMLQVLDDTLGTEEVEDYIDLAGIGIYADMMPMDVLENRYMVIQSMKNIKNIGLLAILKVHNVELDKINSQTIGFTISPMFNGVARKDRIEMAIDLLLCDDMPTCISLVNEMKDLNKQRKLEEKILFEKYAENINHNNKILIAIDENASKGFNGLIANRISQEFKKPSLVMRDHEGTLAGSFRTFGSFPMKKFLNQKSIKPYITYAVGHEFAGGISIPKKNYDDFVIAVNASLKDVEFESVIEYDLEIPSMDINETTLREIEEFDYCSGTGFPPASFLVKELFVEGSTRVMGENLDTIKIPCDHCDVMKFKVNEKWGSDVEMMDFINVVGQLKVNEWKPDWQNYPNITLQIVAEDYKRVV